MFWCFYTYRSNVRHIKRVLGRKTIPICPKVFRIFTNQKIYIFSTISYEFQIMNCLKIFTIFLLSCYSTALLVPSAKTLTSFSSILYWYLPASWKLRCISPSCIQPKQKFPETMSEYPVASFHTITLK